MLEQIMSKVSFEDFIIEGLIQEGAWGQVYAAKRIFDGQPLALVSFLKFFFKIFFYFYFLEIFRLHKKSS